MSLIVSLSPPAFGSVSSSKERGWMSIRCGTSRGLSRREKLLRVTGAALERAKVGDSSDGQRDVDTAQIWAGELKLRATAENNTPPPAPSSLALRADPGAPVELLYASSTVAPASSSSALSLSASSRSTPSLIAFGAS